MSKVLDMLVVNGAERTAERPLRKEEVNELRNGKTIFIRDRMRIYHSYEADLIEIPTDVLPPWATNAKIDSIQNILSSQVEDEGLADNGIYIEDLKKSKKFDDTEDEYLNDEEQYYQGEISREEELQF